MEPIALLVSIHHRLLYYTGGKCYGMGIKLKMPSVDLTIPDAPPSVFGVTKQSWEKTAVDVKAPQAHMVVLDQVLGNIMY